MSAEAPDAAPNIGEAIIHHVSNGEPIVPIHLGPVDLSITKHVLVLWVVAGIVFGLFAWLAGRLRRTEDGAPKGILATMLEFFVGFVREQMVLPFIGAKYASTFTPLIATFFTFILASNLFGLTPVMEIVGWFASTKIGGALHLGALAALEHGSSTVTGNFNVTAGLAVITFCAIIFAGSLAHGTFGHWKNLVPHGLPWAVYIILIPIEVIGMFVKPFALTMRLAANMTAGHAAVIAIMSFIFVFKSVTVGIFVSMPLMIGLLLLEIIVCFVQAYVFSLLSALFIGMAIHVHH